jgi:hypothetical protein
VFPGAVFARSCVSALMVDGRSSRSAPEEFKNNSFFYLLKYRLSESGNVRNKSNSFNLDGILLSFVSNEQVIE